MSLEHILLGMMRKPCSGYDLRQEFEMGAKHFWSAELSQIYPTLKRMEGRGWLESQLEPSPKGPDRRVYQRTKAGQEVLHEWLQSGPVVGNDRYAYIGQLIFMGELNDLETTLEFMQQLREEFNAVYQLLRGAMDELEQESKQRELSMIEFHEKISLRMGVYSLQGKVTWCDESIREVQHRIAQEKTTRNDHV